MAKSEQWRAIPGFHDIYEVSSFGRIKSLARKRVDGHQLPERIMAQKMLPNGYKYIILCKDGVKSSTSVHRLVCLSFYGDPASSTHQAAHLNGDKIDNRVENLSWVSPAENIAHKRKHGTQPFGQRVYNASLTDAKVRELRERRRRGEMIAALAREEGMSFSGMADVIHRRTWKHVA